LMLTVSGEAFEEKKLPRAGCPETEDTDSSAAVVLDIDGVSFVRCAVILRYLARKHHLYGGNNLEAAQVDAVVDLLLEWNASREKRLSSPACDAECFAFLERALAGREYLVGGRLTVADVLFVCFFTTACGEPLPTPGFDELHEHAARLAGLPRLSARRDPIASPSDACSPRCGHARMISNDSVTDMPIPDGVQWWLENTECVNHRSKVHFSHKHIPSNDSEMLPLPDGVQWWLENTDCRDDRSTIVSGDPAKAEDSPGDSRRRGKRASRSRAFFFTQKSCKF